MPSCHSDAGGRLCDPCPVTTAAHWIEGARPRTLPAAIAPVLVGSGAAELEEDLEEAYQQIERLRVRNAALLDRERKRRGVG